MEVSAINGGGTTILVSLADTGASTSLLTRESADRIRIFVREADIELRGLKGPASTVGKA